MTIKNEWLSIGTTVLLKDGSQPLTIIGRYQMNEEDITFDYSGILNPQGFQDSNTMYLFNQSDIGKILFEAPLTEYEQDYLKKLNDFIEREVN